MYVRRPVAVGVGVAVLVQMTRMVLHLAMRLPMYIRRGRGSTCGPSASGQDTSHGRVRGSSGGGAPRKSSPSPTADDITRAPHMSHGPETRLCHARRSTAGGAPKSSPSQSPQQSSHVHYMLPWAWGYEEPF